jgi:integrase
VDQPVPLPARWGSDCPPNPRTVIKEVTSGRTSGHVNYDTTRKEGIHQLRQYYASVMLAGGVSIKELAEYLGHSDPAFTLRVYAHMLPCSYDRARSVITERFTRMIGPDF